MNKHVRTDESAILRVVKDTLNVRLWAISMTLIVILCLVTLSVELSKPKPIAIIDSANGRTFHSVTGNRLNYSVIEKLVMRSSYTFCQTFYSYNAVSISDDRKKAITLMSKNVYDKLPENWLQNDDVKTCVKNRSSSSFDWILNPKITYAKDPNYISFCQFTRDVTVAGISRGSRKINVKLYWKRLENYNYLQAENGLVLVGYEELTDDSKEFKSAITKIKGGLQ